MLLDDEIRIAHREETQNDKIVRDLAKTQALCWCKLEGQLCDEQDCANCMQCKQFMNCYEQLSEYDQTRVTTAAELYYQQLSSPSYTSYKTDVGYIIKVFVLAILLGLFIIWFMYWSTESGSLMPSATLSKVATVKGYMRDYQDKDVYRDGQVDCKDYAYMFKVIWDTLFIDDCVIKYACIQYYDEPDVSYHLMIQVNNKLIEPCYYLPDDYTQYYWLYWIDSNKWCDEKYRSCDYELQKVKRWLVNNVY